MASVYKEPAIKAGMPEGIRKYLMGDAELAAPSIINTSSKYLNDPYYRDVYSQLSLRRRGTDIPGTYCIPMAQQAVASVTDFEEYARLIDLEKAKNPEFAAWLEARHHTAFTIENTAGYAEGTLGRTMWDFLVTTGYQSDKLAPANQTDDMTDIDYIVLRQGSVHDLEHLITGFGTNSAGENAVVWTDVASFANYFSPELAHYIYTPLTFLLFSGLQAQSLHYPKAFKASLEAMRQGIAMGQGLKRPLIMESWEEMFDWQLDDVRAHLGIVVPGPGAAWDWTNEVSMG